MLTKRRGSALTIAVLKSSLDQVVFYHMGILISNKNVDQGLVVESTKPEYLPPLALFCWCGYRCVSLAVSLLCLVLPGAAGCWPSGSSHRLGCGEATGLFHQPVTPCDRSRPFQRRCLPSGASAAAHRCQECFKEPLSIWDVPN